MGPQNAINEILDKVNEIPLEDQGLLLELIRNRYLEKRRDEILANAHQSEGDVFHSTQLMLNLHLIELGDGGVLLP